MTREEAKRHLEAAKLMLLRPDGRPVSDLYDAICVALDTMEQNEEYIILDKNRSKPYDRAKDAKFDSIGFKERVKDGIEQAVKGEEHGTDT